MEYSEITSIEIENFMGYKHAKAYFDEQGILNFKGYNNSGKSAFLEACAVCLMNKYARSQTKFIHHGEEYFRIIISFNDGVVILRDKYINGQSLYEMYRDKKLVFTTKQGSQLSKVDDVPKIIKDYLGLIEVNEGYLNFQTRKEPLWLIDTKGSENYYSLNEILRTVEIARATTLLNSDKNKLNADIVEIEQELQHDELLLREYSSINETLIVALSEKEMYVQNLLNQAKMIEGIKATLTELGNVPKIPDVEGIDIRNMNSLFKLQSTISEIQNISVLPDVSTIPVEQLNAITKIQKSMADLESVNTDIIGISLDKVNIDMYPNLARLQNLLKQLSEVSTTLKQLKIQEEDLAGKKTNLLDEATQQGIKFVECSNCGTLVEVHN